MTDPSHSGERVRRRLALLEEAANGHYEKLPCPDCGETTASVWFTNPAPDEYRTWLLCPSCDFHTHVICAGKPAGFTEDRRRRDLEARDQEILEQMVFRKPKRM
jgi:hypothetical protein